MIGGGYASTAQYTASFTSPSHTYFREDAGIWLDDELFLGYSGKSQTFDNDNMCAERDFKCVEVEVFTFQ